METNEPKAYEIRTVADFLKVPPERITACLAEFAVCVEMMRGLAALNGKVEPRRVSDVGSDALLASSVAWWESFRNTGMTLEEHLARPTHQCRNSCDRKLADAVASYVAANKAVSGVVGVQEAVVFGGFRWIDDGKRNVAVDVVSAG